MKFPSLSALQVLGDTFTLVPTIVMFQECICVKSLIRYCHDSRLFMFIWSICHMDTIP